MKKHIGKLIIIVCILALSLSLAACSGPAKKAAFTDDIYNMYLDTAPQVTPTIKTTPKKADYFLISSNPTIASVKDDGVTLTAHKSGIITVSAYSSAKSAEPLDQAQVIIYTTSLSRDPIITKETHSVIFITEYSSVPKQEVTPNACAVRPESPERPDQVIADWYLDEELTKPFDFNTKIVKDTLLYAKWVVKGDPTYTYKVVEGKTYVQKLTYPGINYGHITLPVKTPDGAKIYGIFTGAFQNSAFLSSITIPSTYAFIGEKAFYNCAKLESVVFSGDGLQTIEKDAFWGCVALTSLDFPNTITQIGDYAFSGCKLFAVGALPSGLKVISEGAFWGTATLSLDLEYVESLETLAFSNSKVTRIVNTDKITRVAAKVFEETPFLTNATDPKHGKGGVAYLNDIIIYAVVPRTTSTVNINSNVRLIANEAFYGINTKKIIKFSSSTPPTVGAGVFNTKFVDILVPKNSLSAYLSKWGNSFVANIYYEEILEKKLTLLVSKSSNTADAVPVVIINKFSDDKAAHVNIKNMLYAEYTNAVRIKAVRTGAFSRLQELQTVTLPPVIYSMEMNAFNELPAFVGLFLDGEITNKYTPQNTVLSQSFMNTLQPSGGDYFISVPKGMLSAYKEAANWSYVKNKLVEGVN